MFSKLSLTFPLVGLALAVPAPKNDLRAIQTFFPTSTGVSRSPGTTGAPSTCVTFYTAKTGDTCSSIAAANSLTTSMFTQMNPSINILCTNLLAGSQYCVASSSSGTVFSSGSRTATPIIFTSASIFTSIPHTESTSQVIGTSMTSSPASSGSQIPDSNQSQVTNSTAFTSGAGNKNNANENDGIGAGTDSYTCFSGLASAYPDSSKWVSFSDMWAANSPFILQGCSNLPSHPTPETTKEQLTFIKNGIQAVSRASLVDHRFILATIMQESIGCVNVGATDNGVHNPGLMQSHNGSSFIGNKASAAEQAASIQQMIIDGTQGTKFGPGAVQGINIFGNIYDAARYYNSGKDNSKTDLNVGEGATPSYVVDIANRLTGWVASPKLTCT